MNQGYEPQDTHILAYVQWSIISRWKRLVLKYAEDNEPIFLYGSNDDRQFEKYAKEGANLWIMASHKDYPPTLVAKLKRVKRIDHIRDTIPQELLREFKPLGKGKKYKYIVKGMKGSRFYGHNNALPVLHKLALLGDNGKLNKKEEDRWIPKKHGIMLIRPHRIQNITPLWDYAKKLQKQTVFISWKHGDVKGRKHENLRIRNFVREFIRELNKEKYAVWIDELALPNYKPKTEDDVLMELLLRQGLTQSQVLLAVASNHYGCKSPESAKNWTKQEWNSKSNANRAILFAENSNNDKHKCDDTHTLVISDINGKVLSGKPYDAARDFARWIKQVP
jgi:hypothetical protein